MCKKLNKPFEVSTLVALKANIQINKQISKYTNFYLLKNYYLKLYNHIFMLASVCQEAERSLTFDYSVN